MHFKLLESNKCVDVCQHEPCALCPAEAPGYETKVHDCYVAMSTLGVPREFVMVRG